MNVVRSSQKISYDVLLVALFVAFLYCHCLLYYLIIILIMVFDFGQLNRTRIIQVFNSFNSFLSLLNEVCSEIVFVFNDFNDSSATLRLSLAFVYSVCSVLLLSTDF